MMVACVMVNRATWSVAAGVLEDVRRRWPTHGALSRAGLAELASVMRRLGFQNQRAHKLKALARAWSKLGPPRDAEDALGYPGLGRYAADSWAIFVEGRTDVKPTDGRLVWYLQESQS